MTPRRRRPIKTWRRRSGHKSIFEYRTTMVARKKNRNSISNRHALAILAAITGATLLVIPQNRLAYQRHLSSTASTPNNNNHGPVIHKQGGSEAEKPGTAETQIKLYIKTSGKPRYLKKAKRGIASWGRQFKDQYYGDLVLIMDKLNSEAVSQLLADYRDVPVSGKEMYFHGTQGDKEVAWRSQRLKLRAAFADFMSNYDSEDESKASDQVGPDWMCLMDDDMLVNVDNLAKELVELQPTCAPDCFVGDKMGIPKSAEHAGGGWCMEKDLALRVAHLLEEKIDEDIGWMGTDDEDFCREVLFKQFDVGTISSDLWYCQFSGPSKGPIKRGGVATKASWDPRWPTWQKDASYMKPFLATLSVYHENYAPPSYFI